MAMVKSAYINRQDERRMTLGHHIGFDVTFRSEAYTHKKDCDVFSFHFTVHAPVLFHSIHSTVIVLKRLQTEVFEHLGIANDYQNVDE